MKKLILLLCCVGLLAGTAQRAWGQAAIVNDPAHMIANIANFGSEISNTLSQLGVTEENLSIVKEISDYTQKAYKLLKDVRAFQSMSSSLNNMLSMMDYYSTRIKNMQEMGFDPYVFTRMAKYIAYSVKAVNRMFDQALDILASNGLEFAEKIKLTSQLSGQIERQCQQSVKDVEEYLADLEGSFAFAGFDAIFNGDDATTVIDNINNEITSAQNSSSSDVVESTKDVVKSVDLDISATYRIVLLLLGILIAVSLVIIMIRYMNNKPEAQNGFVRIFVVIVIVITVLTVISSVFGFGKF